jgi:hypothetical protein
MGGTAQSMSTIIKKLIYAEYGVMFPVGLDF